MMAEGKQEEASQLPYFQDTLQYKMYGQHIYGRDDAVGGNTRRHGIPIA